MALKEERDVCHWSVGHSWWYHHVGHFGGSTTGVGGSPRPCQPQIHQRRQDQGNGERRHSVPHTHSEWTIGAGGYVPVPWVPDTEDGKCTTEFCTRINRGQAIEASLQKIWKSHNIPISTKIRLMKALVWPVATYGCESWTLRKSEETRLDAFEMKGLRRMLRVSWTAKKTNEWVLNKAGLLRNC